MKIKNIVNPSIYFFIIAGLVMFLGKKSWWPSFYDPIFFGWAFLISALLIILPKFIFRTKDRRKQELVIFLRWAIAIVMVLNALGELYLYQLYKYGIQYDKVIHFADSFLFIIVLTSFLEVWYKLPLKKAIKMSIILVLAGCFLWELYEYSSDMLFKTMEFGVYGQYKVVDTFFDILSDMAGMLVGSICLLNPKLSKKIIGEFCHWPVLTESDEIKI